MGERIGIIAGSGRFPLLVAREAGKKGKEVFAAAVRGEADSRLEGLARGFEWIGAGEVSRLLSFFKDNGVSEVIMAGRVGQQALYTPGQWDETALDLLTGLEDRSPASLIGKLVEWLGKQGITVLDPTGYLSPYFCREGNLTRTAPSPEVLADISFGWKAAVALADEDIGQTVIVKSRAVVAVEGQEGTDEAVRRAGRLAGRGFVVVKVCRTTQDPRIDLPAVGLGTLKSLVEAGGTALCFEAERMPFFEREEALSLADSQGVSVIARKRSWKDSTAGR